MVPLDLRVGSVGRISRARPRCDSPLDRPTGGGLVLPLLPPLLLLSVAVLTEVVLTVALISGEAGKAEVAVTAAMGSWSVVGEGEGSTDEDIVGFLAIWVSLSFSFHSW